MKMSELNALLLIVLIMVGFPAIGIYGVRFGCKICAGFVPSIKETAIAIGLFCLAYIPLSIINSVPAIKTNWTAQLLLFVAGLSLSAFILGARLKPQDGCSIGFKKGILVSLVWSGFGIVVFAVGTAVFFGVFMLYGAMFSTPKPQGFQLLRRFKKHHRSHQKNSKTFSVQRKRSSPSFHSSMLNRRTRTRLQSITLFASGTGTSPKGMR